MTICLQLDHVNYSYGAAKIRVLSDVNADFESGKMYAITGPSGAGKSTLLSLLAGLDAPSDGVGAKRDDENFFYVACWEYQGDDEKAPVLHKEPLVYEAIKVQTRNYKS